jgi:hypothetical protein
MSGHKKVKIKKERKSVFLLDVLVGTGISK